MRKKSLLFLLLCAFGLGMINASAYAESRDNEPDYIFGRPMTEEEIERQKSCEPETLLPLPSTPASPEGEPPSLYLAPLGASYPEKYDSRDNNIITAVKDQDISNWCWAYSTVSAMETSMIKKKIPVKGIVSTAENTDLSEASLVYCLYNRRVVADPFRRTLNDYITYEKDLSGYDPAFLGCSGNPAILAKFLSTSMGIKPDSFFTLDMVYNMADGGKLPDFSTAYTDNAAYVKNVKYLPNDRTVWKSAIQTYGSITASYCHEDEYHNFNTAAYCDPNSDADINHSVTIVGWDDSYSAGNFNKNSSVIGNGAWICKNSWSEWWGDDGFFYLSYEDQSLEPGIAIEMQSSDAYDNNYFYDGAPCFGRWNSPSGTKFANSFISGGRQQLKQVSFESHGTNMKYKIQIYKNGTSASNPESGKAALKKPVSGTTSSEGIYTVDIPQKVYLDKGERFSVVITAYSSDGENVFMGCEMNSDDGWYSSKASGTAGQSFLMESWGWRDISSDGTLRIKAYTDNSNAKKVTFKDSSRVISTQYVSPGGSASLTPVKKSGYSIASVTGTYQKVTADSVVTVKWKPNSYTVTYNANGGTVSKSGKKVTYAAKYGTLAKPKRARYDFLGWYTSRSYKTKITASSKYKVAGNQTLYARWRKVSVKKASISRLTSPKAARLKVTVKKISNATGYEIRYSTRRNMSGSKKVLTTKTSKTISGLRRGKTYYVRVRAYHKDSKGNKIYGKSSAVKKIKVK